MSRASYIAPRKWSASHDLMHYLTPYDHFRYDPWDELRALKESLESGDTATFKVTSTPTQALERNQKQMQLFADLLGAWPFNQSSNLATVWVNPYYDQLDKVEWTPDEHKMTHWMRLALVGKWTSRHISAMYNNNSATVDGMFKTRGMTFGDVQAYGRRRLANTVHVTREWTGQSVRQAAFLLDIPPRTLRQWIAEYGTLETVPDPPKDSMGKRW